MKPSRLFLTSTFILTLASCAPHKDPSSAADPYATADPYGTAQPTPGPNAPYQPTTPVAPANPTYDTPAAYEDSSATSAVPTPPAIDAPEAGTPTAGPAGVATTHTVVKGDTLGGIARKYKVPAASIMKANNMTKDIVVLGKKLIIPAR